MDSTKLGASFGNCPEYNDRRSKHSNHSTVRGPESNIRGLFIRSYDSVYNCAVSCYPKLHPPDISLSSGANIWYAYYSRECHH